MNSPQHKNNEKKAEFEKLFQDFSDAIYRLCLYKTSSKGTAEDLTQEVFLRLWKAMTSDTPIEQPKSYMYQIARNLIIDYYREGKATSLEVLRESGFEAESHDASPETIAEVSLLKNAIETMEEDYREVIYLRYVEGLAVQEIAEMLALSENLVSVRIHRGKDKLKEQFTL